MSCNNCCYKNYDDNEYFCEYHMKHIIDYDMDCPDTQDEFISITNVFDRLNEFKHLCKINGACVTEYKKLLKAKDELELYKIIFYNIEWINDCNIFKESYVYLVDSDDFIDDLDLDSLGHIKIKYFDNKTNLSSIKTINGDVLLENIQDYYSIGSDLIKIKKDDLYGVIHKNDLKPIVPIIYNYISDFYNYDENVKFFIVSENKYKHLYSYDIESECSVEIELPKVNDELPTVIKSIDATNFNLSTHFILVYSNDKIILIDETGTPIIDMMSYKDLNYALEIDLKYDDCKLFHKNLGLIPIEFTKDIDPNDKFNRHYKYIYKNNKFDIKFLYDTIYVTHYYKKMFIFNEKREWEFKNITDVTKFFSSFK